MNDMRERLIELLATYDRTYDCDLCPKDKHGESCGNECLADFLLANSVAMWELDGCEYCEEYEDLPEHFVNGKPVGKIFDTTIQTDENGLWHIETCSAPDIGIKFCPMCGRRLPQSPKGE